MWSRSAAREHCRFRVKSVRRGGHIALIGVLAGEGEFDPRLMMLKAARLQGIYVGSREMFEEMNRAISLAGMRPVIDRVFEFGELPEALQYLESGAHFGKIVLCAGCQQADLRTERSQCLP